MGAFWVLVKKTFQKIDHLLCSILFFGITPRMISTITGHRYKVDDTTAWMGTWKEFRKEARGKRVVLLGLDGVSVDFIAKHQKEFDIACIYTFAGYEKIRDCCGIPVKNAEHFRGDIYGGNNAYLIASSYSIEEYIEVLRQNGIANYFSYVVMENKKFHYRVRRPFICFRYIFLYQFFHRDGLFTNYILFPIKAFLRKMHFPGIYDHWCDEIQQYKNIHLGERCFIVATGPSLRVEDVEMLKGEVTFGVNGIFKMYAQTDWRPTYYGLCDPYVYLDYIKKGYIVDLDGFAEKGAFLPKRLEKVLYKNRHTQNTKLIPVCYLNHLLAEKETRFHYSDDPVWGFYNSRTVACYCANIAQYMGFKEIYFLGIDCDYITNGQHFSDEKSPNITQVKELKYAQRALIKAFTFLKGEMDKRGIQVYNATRGGALEVFPRVSLEEVLGRELPVSVNKNTCLEDEAALEKMDVDAMQLDEELNEFDAVDVSIIVLTYNHERYIRQALDSILSQKTDFTYEVLVGDDASLDDTPKILKEYAEQYPKVFKLFLNKENTGAAQNAWNLFSCAKGRYIANLEGDDWWCTDNKLQQQIEFLDKNPEYIGCTHACRWIDKFGKTIWSIAVNNGQKCSGDYTIDDLKDGMWQLPGQTGALTYRNIYRDQDNAWLKELILLDRAQCDRSVALALASLGPIKCMPAVMSNYRLVVSSASSHAARYHSDVRRKQEMIRYFQLLENYTDSLLGEHIVFNKRKESIFKDAVRDCWPDISEDENLVLNEIIMESGDESHYRELYSDVQESMQAQREADIVKKAKQTVKGVVLFIPRFIKESSKKIRGKWFSPMLHSAERIEKQMKRITADLKRTSTQVQELKENLEFFQSTREFTENSPKQVEEKNNGK